MIADVSDKGSAQHSDIGLRGGEGRGVTANLY